MPTNWPRALLAVVATVCLVTLTSWAPAGAQRDARQFADLLAQRDASDPAAGPLSGELIQDANFSTVVGSGVALADFAVSATFVNPAEPGAASWDFGFLFHQGDAGAQHIIIDSAGVWYVSPAVDDASASGPAAMVDATPGASNTVDLFVEGETALLGINGEFVASIPLPPGVESDVQVGSGFYADTTEPGRVIGYTDFAVWPLPLPRAEQAAPTTTVIEVEGGEPATPAAPSPTAGADSVIQVEGEATAAVSPTPPAQAGGEGDDSVVQVEGEDATTPAPTPGAGVESVIQIEGEETAPPTQTTPSATPAAEREATPAPETGSDAEAFALLLEQQAEAMPAAGPFTANLKEEEGRVAQSWAGVSAAEFHARATFGVPRPDSETPWDIGITFGTSPNGPATIVVDSLGNWSFAIGDGEPVSQGTLEGLVTEPGGENRIDLFVAGQQAVFGVNGSVVSTIDLPSDVAAGDVAVGAGYVGDQVAAGRVTPFRDFALLPFDAAALAGDPAETSEFAPEDVEALASFLAEIENEEPVAGPFTGRLVEAEAGIVPQAAAGIALENAGVVVSFTNPEDLTTAPWDGGIQFRSAGDQTHRVILRSTGDVYVVLPDGTTTIAGQAAAYDATPGAANELQLVIEGSRALVGVNGELAAVVALPDPPVAADILAGAAFFGEDYVQDRVTAYEGFRVWDRT